MISWMFLLQFVERELFIVRKTSASRGNSISWTAVSCFSSSAGRADEPQCFEAPGHERQPSLVTLTSVAAFGRIQVSKLQTIGGL